MGTFEYSSLIDAPVGVVFAFHERADALEILSPPFPPVRVVSRTGGIRPGDELTLEIGVGPVRVRWVARHVEFVQDELFVDEQVSGPFTSWVHRHQFKAAGDKTLLTDHVTFSLPGGRLVERIVRWRLRAMFTYRHAATRLHIIER